LAEAGLDVFMDEPKVPTALLDMKNVVLQSHCASGTHKTGDAKAQLVVDNIAAHFAGRALLTPVEKLWHMDRASSRWVNLWLTQC